MRQNQLNDNRKTILSVRNLKTYFYLDNNIVIKAVDDVSFDLYEKEILGVIGESGSGKSVMSKSIFKLVQPPGKIINGEAWLDGIDLLSLSNLEIRKVRGKDISMIFQEPMTSLNPSFSIGWQLGEVYKLHGGYKKKEIREKIN